MIHIAVVEDDPAYRRHLLDFIDDYQQETGEQFQVAVFSDGLEIVQNHNASFQIILMDIEMKHLDGLQAAKRIRRNDRDVIIIFITNLAQFAIQGYEVEALDYVLKPVNYFAFSQVLQRAVKKVKQKSAFFLHIVKESSMIRLDASSISYIESQGHNVIYHTDHGDYTCRDSLKNLEEKLEGRHFSRCNSGYLVNLAHVERVEKNDVTVSGVVLPVSRPRKKGFMEDLANYVGGE